MEKKKCIFTEQMKTRKPKATGTDNETNKVEKTDGDAEKVTKTTYWEYKTTCINSGSILLITITNMTAE